jgi:transposase
MMSRYIQSLTLTESEEAELQAMLEKGVHSVRSLKRGQVLLRLHQGNNPKQVVEQVGVSLARVYNIAQRYQQEGLDSALKEKPRPGQPSKFDKALQAQLTALACSPAPEGHCRWSLRLLADKVVEVRWVDSISHQAVGEQLKKIARAASA